MPGHYGYADRIMRVDLSSGGITTTPTIDYANRFLGGRGIGTKIYWDEVSPEVKENNRRITENGHADRVLFVPIEREVPKWLITMQSLSERGTMV